MAEHLHRIGQMEQEQPAHDRVERLVEARRAHVGLHEADVVEDAALLGDGQRRRLAIDADDRPVRADELGHLRGDVTDAGTEVEHAHPAPDAGGAQQRVGGAGDRGRLAVEPRDLRRRTAQHVLGHGITPSVRIACLIIRADMIAPTRLRCSPSLWRRITVCPFTTAE